MGAPAGALDGLVEMEDGKIRRLKEIIDTRPFHDDERPRMFAMNRLTPYWPKGG